MRDGFRWKPDTLRGIGTCLGWVLIEKTLKKSKNTLLCSFLCACAACIHAYVGLFLSACVCSLVHEPKHACSILCMQPYSCACVAPGRNPSLGIWTPFSSVLHQFGILTSFLTIFASHYMPHITSRFIVDPISLSHYSFHLIMNLMPFSFCGFYLHILVEGVLAGHWYGTTFLLRRLGVTFVLCALSPSSTCCLRGLLVLS